jgi:hypothetical protein
VALLRQGFPHGLSSSCIWPASLIFVDCGFFGVSVWSWKLPVEYLEIFDCWETFALSNLFNLLGISEFFLH